MDVLLVYCDSGAPSRYLRYLEVGLAHQVLADGQIRVSSALLHADRRPEEIINSFRQQPGRLVAFYLDEFNAGVSFKLIGELRAAFPDVSICAFGIYPTLSPEKTFASKNVDYIVIGEGEIALFELATQLIRGGDIKGIKNLWWRQGGNVERNPLRPLQENLDVLPFPDRSLFAQEPQSVPMTDRTLYIGASRGCPYDCLFCYSPVLKRAYGGKGNYYRTRTAQSVGSEIHSEMRRQAYGSVCFVDEVFPTDKLWLKQFAQRMSGGAPISFQCTLVAEKCDADTLDALKAAGCARICLGVETGNEGFRKRIATRNQSNERLKALVAAARERGIAVTTTNIIGLPLESEPLMAETCTYNQELAPDEIRCTVYQPIEGSALNQYAHEKHYDEEKAATRPDFTQMSLHLPELSPEVVRNYLYKIHFLNLIQKLHVIPPAQGYFDFLGNLTRAKFQMHHTSAVDVGTATRGGKPFGYLSVETSTECIYSVTMQPHSMLRFSLCVPEASFRRIEHAQARLMAELVWRTPAGEQTLFCKLVRGGEPGIFQNWQDCVAGAPEEGGVGEIVFRVGTIPPSDLKACVFWGMPVLIVQDSTLRVGDSEQIQAEYEEKIAAMAKELAGTRAELEKARADEQSARAERDQKVQRIGELQIRLLELEKQLESHNEIVAELEQFRAQKDAGLSGKFKGMFKK